jgi:hypothetical protein
MALLQHDPLHRRKWAKKLYACLDETLKYLPDMKAHHFRVLLSHKGTLYLAPYLLMPNLPYLAATVDVLRSGPWLDDKEKTALEKTRLSLPGRIARIRDAHGNFGTYHAEAGFSEGEVESAHSDAPEYSNSFGGIALASLCAMERGESSNGVVDPELISWIPAISAVRTTDHGRY